MVETYLRGMKPVFPTTYSTLSAAALVADIQEHYALRNVQCRFLVRGVGDTYLVESGPAKFIFRVYRSEHRTEAHVRAEVELLRACKNAGVSVSHPLPDNSGGFIREFRAAEGARYGVLFTYAAGLAVPMLTDAQLRELGHQMALFHKVSSTVKLSGSRWIYDADSTLTAPLNNVRDFFANDPDDYAWLQQQAARVKARLVEFDASKITSGYCHFDFLPKNFHFDGDRITLFDFDFLGYGWLANDVMTFWQQLCLDAHFGRMSQDAADRAYAVFVEAYQQHRSLSPEDLAVVPYLALGWWIFFLGFYTTHDQFYSQLQSPHLKMRINVVRQLISKYVP